MTCKKCSTISGVLFLIFGILFLIRDLTSFDVWGITPWSALFVIIGLACWAKGHCKDCQAK